MKIRKWVLLGWFYGGLGASLFAATVHSGDTLDVRSGTTPTIDGVIAAGEWDDALRVVLLKDPTLPATDPDTGAIVYVKHDAAHLYLGFRNTPGVWGIHGVFVDRLDDGGQAPKPDDYWFNYDSDLKEKREWVGDNSFWVESSSITGWDCRGGADELEYTISFAKVGITPGSPKLLGFHIGKGGAAPWEYVWPRHGEQNARLDLPETWGDIRSSDNWSGIDESPFSPPFHTPVTNYSISPNPAADWADIRYTLAADTRLSLKVYDIAGKLVKTLVEGVESTGDNIIRWDGRNGQNQKLPAGIYFCRLEIEHYRSTTKLVQLK